MQDYEYRFCLYLHDKIRSIVKPSVYVTVDERDRLCVTIHDKHYGLTFEYLHYDFTNKFKEGLDVDVLTNRIIRDYKKFLNYKFFKKLDDRQKGGGWNGR